tara:strand:- start:30 stop:149 length:120 start_codon:yes stop_codon:yes gene_type:complete
MDSTRMSQLRNRFVRGILLGLEPEDLHEFVTGDEPSQED